MYIGMKLHNNSCSSHNNSLIYVPHGACSLFFMLYFLLITATTITITSTITIATTNNTTRVTTTVAALVPPLRSEEPSMDSRESERESVFKLVIYCWPQCIIYNLDLLKTYIYKLFKTYIYKSSIALNLLCKAPYHKTAKSITFYIYTG